MKCIAKSLGSINQRPLTDRCRAEGVGSDARDAGTRPTHSPCSTNKLVVFNS